MVFGGRWTNIFLFYGPVFICQCIKTYDYGIKPAGSNTWHWTQMSKNSETICGKSFGKQRRGSVESDQECGPGNQKAWVEPSSISYWLGNAATSLGLSRMGSIKEPSS